MLKGLYTAYTGMIQEQQRMDTLTNNLANSDTAGFKKEGLTSQSFDAVLVDKIKDDSDPYYYRRIGKANPGVKIGPPACQGSPRVYHHRRCTKSA